uniref:hypothetical protein n=1 Tax=Paractinoplanes polyasparticus TaxID=2856853 RepID=UPI001C861372|nr:hypothetical protein [Actinoplanes polyasparticus]
MPACRLVLDSSWCLIGRLTEVGSDVLPSTLLSEFERVLRKAFPPVDGKTRVPR